MAELKNRLKELGVIGSEGKITDDYTEWFCSKRERLEFRDYEEKGYNALSKFGKRVVIRSRDASDIDFGLAFGGIYCVRAFMEICDHR